MMFGKDVVVVFEEITLGVVDVGTIGPEDEKVLVNGDVVGVGLGCGSVGSVGSIGRVGRVGRMGRVAKAGSNGRRVGAAFKEEKDTRKRRRMRRDLRMP